MACSAQNDECFPLSHQPRLTSRMAFLEPLFFLWAVSLLYDGPLTRFIISLPLQIRYSYWKFLFLSSISQSHRTRDEDSSDFDILKSRFISNFTAAHTRQFWLLSVGCWNFHILSCTGIAASLCLQLLVCTTGVTAVPSLQSCC